MFSSAHDAAAKEEEARSKGEKLPEQARFDSNCITPGMELELCGIPPEICAVHASKARCAGQFLADWVILLID